MKRNKLVEFDYLYTRAFSGFYFIGIDEVGRGALAGPVISCAFSWKKEIILDKNSIVNSLPVKLNDSKQLSKKEREELNSVLVQLGDFALGYASVQEIEKFNILNATFLSMKRAFEKLIETLYCRDSKLEPYVLIDGNKFNPYINSRQSFIVDGDAKSSLIASASIIAKVYRDMLMSKMSKLNKYKKFGWAKNVGYGTPSHRRAIRKHGATPLHRKLFIRNTLSNNKKIRAAL